MVVEKDYVIGWLLMGLSTEPRMQTQWKSGLSRLQVPQVRRW